MDARQILVEARAKIADPSNWTTDAQKLTSAGPYCMVSACANACRGVWDNFHIIAKVLAGAVGTTNVPEWNDTHTHAEVLAAFDKAIASLTPKQTDIAIFTDMLKEHEPVS